MTTGLEGWTRLMTAESWPALTTKYNGDGTGRSTDRSPLLPIENPLLEPTAFGNQLHVQRADSSRRRVWSQRRFVPKS